MRAMLRLALAAAIAFAFWLAIRSDDSTEAPSGPGAEVARSGADVSCDLVASPDGTDDSTGGASDPVRGVGRLVDLLRPGQTGCLREGSYVQDQLPLSTPLVTLTSYPGERATIRGRIWVTKSAAGTVIEDLDLDGRNSRRLPSPTVNADDVTIRGNDITNDHTGICVSVGSLSQYGRPSGTRISNNLIHDCGTLPPTNFEHGIYVAAADGTVIRGNRIYDNADRGIQLFPDAQGTRVIGNVISGNGEGVIFGGDRATASSGNLVARNLIVGSSERGNVESHWVGPVGIGNVLRDNCIGGGSYDDGDLGIEDPPVGFTALDNEGPDGDGCPG